jgi:hypothetical protein
MMAGPGAARLMDTLLGILRRAALIGKTRPDRGYTAIDRTPAFGARVGRWVGGSRIYIEQIAAVRARGRATCLFVAFLTNRASARS